MRSLCLLGLCAALAQSAPAQFHFLTDLTQSPGIAFDNTAFAPDGSRILCRRAGVWGTINFAVGSPFTAIPGAGNTPVDVIWRRDSQGWFWSEPTSTAPGAPRQVRTVVSGSSSIAATNQPSTLHIFDVDPTGTRLACTFFANPNWSIRVLNLTTGGAVDVAVGPTTLGDVSFDPTGSRILFRIDSGSPFSPNVFARVAATGGAISFITPGGVLRGENGRWISATAMVCQELISPFTQIVRFDVNTGARTQLSAGRRNHTQLSVSNDRQFLSCMTSEVMPSSPPAIESVPAIMPASGGGLVMLDNGPNFAAFSFGSLWVDPTGVLAPRFAVALKDATTSNLPQIIAASMENDVFASRGVVGAPQSFTMNNPVAGGAVLGVAALGRLITGVPIGFVNPLLVDLTTTNVTLFFTAASSGSFTWTVTPPVGLDIFCQGATLFPNGTVQLSRLTEVTLQ